ncbi:hypothetical protein F511_29721 [Dorcoceras hygrometricum]|uniref:Uncharacterized protein n=1 Tax=Dorcoceras hygrometricum TaxID=472368 RepID=A0A2Z7ATK1_9LAMI|nr:hypothetical protein F511_29721 [Dorcoceras hygrometricum]
MPTQVFFPCYKSDSHAYGTLAIRSKFVRKIFNFIKETIGNSLWCLERLAARPAVFSCSPVLRQVNLILATP